MTASVAQIWRHPIKGHSREAIESVTLAAGQTMPWDRKWAVTHRNAKTDGSTWAVCGNFSRGSKAPGLMGISAKCDESAGLVTLQHPDLDEISLNPDTEADRLIEWARPLMPEGGLESAGIVRVPGRGMTDSDFPSISLGSLTSIKTLSQKMGIPIDPERFRMNFWIEGLAPWEEFEWIGQRLKLGRTEIEVRERTTRCRATMANPKTGKIDADTLAALNEGWGHQDFGVYAEVVKGGTVSVDDPVARIQ